MIRLLKRKQVLLVIAVLCTLAFAVLPVCADEAGNDPDTELSVKIEAIPGHDLVAEGTDTQEAYDPSGSSSSAARAASGTPKTGETSDLGLYLVILFMAGAAAFVYRQNVVMEKRRGLEERTEEEIRIFREECRMARKSM